MTLRSVLLFAALAMPLGAQQGRSVIPDTYDPAANDPFKPRGGDQDGTKNEFLQHRMAEARKTDRKRRMVDTANRLLLLSKQLQADLQEREATPDDLQRLDEMARLARMVKNEMRN